MSLFVSWQSESSCAENQSSDLLEVEDVESVVVNLGVLGDSTRKQKRFGVPCSTLHLRLRGEECPRAHIQDNTGGCTLLLYRYYLQKDLESAVKRDLLQLSLHVQFVPLPEEVATLMVRL